MSNTLVEINQPTGRLDINAFAGKTGGDVQFTMGGEFVQLDAKHVRLLAAMLKKTVNGVKGYGAADSRTPEEWK